MSDPHVEPATEAPAPTAFVVAFRSLFAGLTTELVVLAVFAAVFLLAGAERLPAELIAYAAVTGLVTGGVFALAELTAIKTRAWVGVIVGGLLAPSVLLSGAFTAAWVAEGSWIKAWPIVGVEAQFLMRPPVLIFVVGALALYAPLLAARRRGATVGLQAVGMLRGAAVLVLLAAVAPNLLPALRGDAWLFDGLSLALYLAVLLPRAAFPAALALGEWLAGKVLTRLGQEPPAWLYGRGRWWLTAGALAVGLLGPVGVELVVGHRGQHERLETADDLRARWLATGEELYARGQSLEEDGPRQAWDSYLLSTSPQVGLANQSGREWHRVWYSEALAVLYDVDPCQPWFEGRLLTVAGVVDPVSSFSDVFRLPGTGYYELAAERGHPPALVEAGRFATWMQDVETARHRFEEAAATGDAGGLWHLGLLHVEGRGVPRDLERGEALLRRAADSGDPFYAGLYATRCWDGRTPASAETLRYARQAGDAGNAYALRLLATIAEREGDFKRAEALNAEASQAPLWPPGTPGGPQMNAAR